MVSNKRAPVTLRSASPGFSQGCCSTVLLCGRISFWGQFQCLLTGFPITIKSNLIVNSVIVIQPHVCVPDPSFSFGLLLTRPQDSCEMDWW